MRKVLIFFGLILLLSGCATYTLVEPHRTTIGDLYTVDPQIPWSEAKSGNTQIWTVDGPALQELRFVNGIADGESPFVGLLEEEKSPKFRKGMTYLEIKDLIVDGLSVMGAYKIDIHKVASVQFGANDGIRMELDFVNEAGLEKSGLVLGSVIHEKLYLIAYSGTRTHYFAKHKDHVEHIIDSIQMEKSSRREE